MAFSVSWVYKAVDKFSGPMLKMRRSSEKLDRAVVKNEKAVRRLGTTSTRTSAALKSGARRMLAAATVFLSATAVFRKGMAFQDAAADLSAITGAMGDDLEMLQAEAFRMGKAGAVAGNEVLTGMKLVASAKPELLKNLPALAAMTEQVITLKNAAGMDMPAAAEAAATSLNIFGKEANQAGKFIDILAAGAKFGSSEITNSYLAARDAGPAAHAAGLSFLQLNAAIQTTARGGFVGTRAGTALNAIFSRLKKSGIDIQKIGLERTFELIGKNLEAQTSLTARAAMEEKLFGMEHAKVGLALVKNRRLLTEFENVLGTSGVAQEQATTRLGTLSAKLRTVGVVIEEKLVRLFIRLEPRINTMVDRFGAWIDSIDDDKIDKFADSVSSLVGVMSNLATVAGTVLKLFDLLALNPISKAIDFSFGGAGNFGELMEESGATDATKAKRRQRRMEQYRSMQAADLVRSMLTLQAPDNRVGAHAVLAPAYRAQFDANINLNDPGRYVRSVESKGPAAIALNQGPNLAAGR